MNELEHLNIIETELKEGQKEIVMDALAFSKEIKQALNETKIKNVEKACKTEVKKK